MVSMNPKVIRMTTAISFCLTVLFTGAGASEPVVPDDSFPHFSYSLSKSSITSGEPITLDITWGDVESEVNYSVVCCMMCRYAPGNILIEILDHTLKPTEGRRHVVAMPSSQAYCPFPQKQSVLGGTLRIPIHLFVSTDIPEGSYYVRLSALEISSVDKRTKERKDRVLSSAPLPLVVHKGAPGEVTTIYKKLLESGLAEYKRYYSGSWMCQDWRDYPPDLYMVLWAYGPSAVKTQIDALYDTDKHKFRFWSRFTVHAYQNILEYGSVEDIRRLAAIAESPEFMQGDNSRGYDSNLVWLFQVLKKKGNPDMLPLIEPTLARFPEKVNILSLESPM